MHPSSLTYDELFSRVRELGLADQLRLLEMLAALVRQEMAPSRRRSILELRGLGKEIWQGIDAQEYVNKERASWSG